MEQRKKSDQKRSRLASLLEYALAIMGLTEEEYNQQMREKERKKRADREAESFFLYVGPPLCYKFTSSQRLSKHHRWPTKGLPTGAVAL